MSDITRYTESLEYNLESTARVVREAISAKFKELDFGLTYDEFIILDEIFHEPGILQIELAKKILKGRAHTGKFLLELEEKGYIERHKALRGKRQVIMPLYITEKGEQVIQIGINTCKNFIEKLPVVNPEEMNFIIKYLKNLKKDVEKEYRVKFI